MSQDIALHKNKSVGISTGGLTQHRSGTIILVVRKSMAVCAVFGINLLMSHTVWRVEA